VIQKPQQAENVAPSQAAITQPVQTAVNERDGRYSTYYFYLKLFPVQFVINSSKEYCLRLAAVHNPEFCALSNIASYGQ